MIQWMPEASKQIIDGATGKPFKGGNRETRLLVLHSTETNGWPRYSWPPHLTAHIQSPTMLENGLRQHIPFDEAAYALRENWLEDDYLTWQVEMIGWAGKMHGYSDLVYENIAWICQWFVHHLDVPPEFADFSVMKSGKTAPQRMEDDEIIAFDGIIGHAHFGRDVDEHWDPGRLDVARVESYMEGAEMAFNSLKLGDEGNLVAWYQQAIIGWRLYYEHPDKVIEVTSVFDEPTESAVKEYQKNANVEQNGVIDGAIAPALQRFHPWFNEQSNAVDQPARNAAQGAHDRLDTLHDV